MIWRRRSALCEKGLTHTNERLTRRFGLSIQSPMCSRVGGVIQRGLVCNNQPSSCVCLKSAEISRKELTAEWDGATYR